MKNSPRTIGGIQALALTGYVGLFATGLQTIIPWLESHIGNTTNKAIPMILFLLTFMTSALICSSIALLHPIRLYTAGNKAEALSVVLSTVVGLIVILLAILGFYIF